MSETPSVSSKPDVDLTEILLDRFGLYRGVVVAAMRMPRPLNNGNQAMVDDRKLDFLWDAIDRLQRHSEDLEALL